MSEISYRYVCDIARGGLGRVALAYREEGDFLRTYAIKRLLPAYESDPEMRSMFADEGRVAGLLRHPNVVSVIDMGEDDEGMYLVMDYIEGVPLSHLIKRLKTKNQVLPIQHCIQIIQQVCDGLQAAHELKGPDGLHLGLVHRDVSPQNILIEPNGVVRVTDFGIAKGLGRKAKTSTGLIKGKAGYMAPECLQFEDPDRRADLFALGVVLYELVAGERLYGGRDLAKVARRILKEAPPDLALFRSDVPDDLVALGFELLSKSPEMRPATAKDVSKRLAGILRAEVAEDAPEDLEDYLKRHIDFAIVETRRDMLEEARRTPDTDVTPSPAGVSVPSGLVGVAPAPSRSRLRTFALALGLVALGVGAGAIANQGASEATEAGDSDPAAENRVATPLEGIQTAVPEPIDSDDALQPQALAQTDEAQEVSPAEQDADDSEPGGVEPEPSMRQRPTPMRERPRETSMMTETASRWGWGDMPSTP